MSRYRLSRIVWGVVTLAGLTACARFGEGTAAENAAPHGPFASVDSLQTFTSTPHLLALAGSNVFVMTDDGQLRRVEASSSAAVDLPVPSPDRGTTFVGLDGDDRGLLLAGNRDDPCGAPSSVWSAPVTGDAFTKLMGICIGVSAVAVDSQDFVWTRYADLGGTVVSAIDRGGRGQPVRTLVDHLDPVASLFSTADDVFIGTVGGTVLRLTKATKALSEVARTSGRVRGIVADDAAVYWLEEGGHVAKRGSSAPGPEVLTTEPAGLSALSHDATQLYFTNEVTGSVRSVAKAGGPTVDVATGQGAPTAVRADAGGVWWIDARGKRLVRAHR